jgi:hypothetical protein
MAAKRAKSATQPNANNVVIHGATVELVPVKRSIEARVIYENGPLDDVTPRAERYVFTAKASTAEDALAKVRAWFAKQNPDKITRGCCFHCGDGQTMHRKKIKAGVQIHCGACGTVLYRDA